MSMRKSHTLLMSLLSWLCIVALSACTREPPLHLHDDETIEVDMPIIAVELDVFWDYALLYGGQYDWRQEWYYGWDETDEQIFGTLGYEEPDVFQLRRYYTDQEANGPHVNTLSAIVYGKRYEAKYSWGYWDILVWNDIQTSDGVQSLRIDESHADYVTATTGQSMAVASYANGSNSYYQPEQLFAGYEQAISVDKNMADFEYDADRNVWIRELQMELQPITYIYLVQVILHNNNGKITGVDGNANLSGMAKDVRVNDGITGNTSVNVYYNTRLKRHCDMEGEDVDIIGGRLMTFGMCDLNPARLGVRDGGLPTRIDDGKTHLIDVTMQFMNGYDSTFVFDVSDKIQERFKGGVLTVELDCDEVPLPVGRPGSGFDASVEDIEDGGTHEIEM